MRAPTLAFRRARARRVATVAAVAAALLVPAGAAPAQTPSPATELDGGAFHSCAVYGFGLLRCWGFGLDGQLGYGNRNNIGDDERPSAVGPVNVGATTVSAISTGDSHTCALLGDGTVRCWGYGFDGRLGYGNRNNIGDDEPPAAVGPVALGGAAVAISAGGHHTCAILVDASVRCWGEGAYGQLGYGTTNNVGDGGRGQSDTPAAAGAVALGAPATAIAAGGRHTCAILTGGRVRCWGYAASGQLGYGSTSFVSAPSQVGDVDLGPGRSAVAISAGDAHTCAVLDDASVRCWGDGLDGRLGYAATANVGDNELPAAAGPVDLGGTGALAVSAGSAHTCAVLQSHAVRCWGLGANGRLGLGATASIGDDEPPIAAGPIDVGAGRTVLAVAAGQAHTCARLDDGAVRCWGYAKAGRLGVCESGDIGDDELPAAIAPLDLTGADAPCPLPISGAAPPPPPPGEPARPATPAPPPVVATGEDPLAAERRRAQDLRRCLSQASRAATRKRASARRACRTRHGRTPGRIRGLRARAASARSILLSFLAPGSNGDRAPAARVYVVKQSRRQIRGARAFDQAQTLCKGSCRFAGVGVGTKIELTITGLRPRTTYHYAVAALDNVSRRRGPRSTSVRATTR